MIAQMAKLLTYRELLYNWTVREIKVRYKQSVLGIAWAILQPLSMTIIFTAVFTLFAEVETEGIPYPIFSYAALLPWTFFSNALSFASSGLIRNTSLITKIYFPREILVLASIMSSFFDFVISSLIFFGLMIYYGVPLSATVLLVIPVFVLQVALTIGLSLATAAINVFYRDVRFVIPLAMQLWMYVSPVIYPVSSVPENLRHLYMLNPMAPILDSYRRILLQGLAPDWRYLALAAAVSVGLLVISYSWFKRVEMNFADII
jgi:lipopolysaccharide transport system permease protein